MDKLTSIRIKYSDGTYLDEVPIGVLAQNVGYDSGHNLIQVLGSVDVDSDGTIQQQINRLFNEKLNSSDLSSYVNSKITTDVSTWLANNVNPVGSAVIVDQSLSISGAAADAKVAGDEINTLKSIMTKQLSPVAFSPNLVKGQYISLSIGRKYNHTKYARTSSLWYGAGQRYAISVTNPDYEFNLMFYDQNGSLDNGNGYIKGTEYITNDVIIVPSYAIYFGMNFRRVDEQAITDDDIVTIRNSILRFALTDKTLTQEDKAADAKVVGDEISALKNTYSIDKTSGTIIDCYIGLDEGTIKHSARIVKTVYFSCLPNAYYMLEHGLAGVFVVACYDRVPVVNLNATKFVNDKGRAQTIFKTDSTAQYLAVYYYSSKFNTETPEEVFNGLEIKTIGFDSIIDFMVDTENKDEIKSVAHDFYISWDDVSVASTFEDVIELYDELTLSYPEYVTKNTLTSGTFMNYEYVFTTGDYNAKNGKRKQEPRIKKPVILLLSGIHGYERSAVMSLYTVMKHMCENNYELTDLIGYVTIKVIPVGDPWSYTNNSRVNANGVNINRNFDAPEWFSDGEGTIDYSGAEPADQDETQIIQNWIDANTDAILFIDFHNSAFANEISCLISSNLANQSDYKRKYLLGMNKIIPYFIKEKGIIGENIIYCYTGGSGSFNNNGRQAISYAYRHGIEDAFVHESSWNVNNTGKHSKISIGTGAEVIGNMLIAFKSYYENIEIIPWTPE